MELENLLNLAEEKGYEKKYPVPFARFRNRNGFVECIDASAYPIFARIEEEKGNLLRCDVSNFNGDNIVNAITFGLWGAGIVGAHFAHSYFCVNGVEPHYKEILLGGFVAGVTTAHLLKNSLYSLCRKYKTKEKAVEFAQKLKESGAFVDVGERAVNAAFYF